MVPLGPLHGRGLDYHGLGAREGSSMSIPTKSEEFSKLIEYIRKAQEAAAMLAHLNNADGDTAGRHIAKGWLGIEELLKRMVSQVTKLATRGLQ